MRFVTWNLFHGRDGLPGARGHARAPPGCAVPEEDGVHMHVNRKLTDLMAGRIAAWEPDVCALQEVPTAAIARIAADTGMRPVWTTTGPLIGPARLRDALAAAQPRPLAHPRGQRQRDPASGPAWRSSQGAVRSVRLNPLRDDPGARRAAGADPRRAGALHPRAAAAGAGAGW